MSKITYRIGDCVQVLKEYPENHFNACVTDPPYGLGFMGKEWDKDPKAQEWHEIWAVEVLRVLKPGAHLLAFGGTRTWHRLACALEDAGFEIRDTICWLYGQGFPKSLDVSKAIDKRMGAEREVISIQEHGGMTPTNTGRYGWNTNETALEKTDRIITAPTSDAAKKWSGWGTALKPAFEPIIVARKPLVGTVAENVLKYGTGGLNIDGGRIGTIAEKPWGKVHPNRGKHPLWDIDEKTVDAPEPHPQGRWPANVILDEEAAKMLDEQSGERGPPGGPGRQEEYEVEGRGYLFPHMGNRQGPLYLNEKGGASRFFYTAKASRGEREMGLGKVKPAGAFRAEDRAPIRNVHPTVKPLDLMRYLVRLVTPPGGLVLDPFLGSGTTLLACRLENLNGIGIEKEVEYEPIIKGRLSSIPPSLEEFE
mgnify:FL=1